MKATRRNFLIGAGVVGGGLVVGFSMRGGPGAPRLQPVEGAYAPNAFLQIGPDNVMRFYCPRDEMGQGVTTGLATLVGEELDVDPAKLLVEFAGVHEDYGNPAMGGVQATGASNATSGHFLPLRQVGADTRRAIVLAAAQQLGVPAHEIATEDGHVLVRGERHPYGAFVETAQALPLPESTPLKSESQFRYIGKELPRIDSLEKATGTAVFGIDVDIPDMHHAVVKRSPVIGGTVASFDARLARGMPGVVGVVEVASGVAIVATQYWQARKAAEAVRVEWDLPPLAAVSSRQIEADYRHALAEEGESAESEGDVAAALAASRTVEAEYWAPYLAHAPMEPMNAVVRIGDGEAEVWTGTQALGIARGLVARVTGFDPERVTAHNTYLGGAFGRRATMTHVVEAAQAAQATGKPVQVLWSREDDIRSGVYRPASLMRIEAGMGADGGIAAWRAKRVGGNIVPDILRQMLPGLLPGMSDGVIDWAGNRVDGLFGGWLVEPTAVEGLAGDYDLPNREVAHVTKDHGLPLTFWRSVGHSFTAFAKESMIDELAAAGGIDPVDVRLRNTTKNPRMREVVRIAGERMRQMPVPPGHALGFAAHGSFGSFVAEVAEVSVEGGGIRVHNVLCVVDCGRVINPDVVRAQMEGSVMYGLTAALHGNLEVENGAIRESNFHDYPILRMNEAPAVEVVMVGSTEHPSGVGEPGVPPIAPAVANAVYAATGQRLRSLPLRLKAV